MGPLAPNVLRQGSLDRVIDHAASGKQVSRSADITPARVT
jgi:hypothetical protein